MARAERAPETADRDRGGGSDGRARRRPEGCSAWVGVRPDVDPLSLARLLRRAHERTLTKGAPPPILRDLVARSWERAADAGVDPDGRVPKVLDEPQTKRSLARHPVTHLLPMVKGMLAEATADARYFSVLSDAEGVLLWANGHPGALEMSVRPGFLPGHLASESAVGTNAIGTALALGHPVQIFSAEHFNRLLHGWTCSAAPIRDPESQAIVGALDLSGEFRSGHPHSLSLISAVVRVIEDKLSEELSHRDERLKELYLERIAPRSGPRSALVTRTGRVLAASPRGWLGPRVQLPDGTGPTTLANGAAVTVEPIGEGGARIVRPAPRRRAATKRPKLRLEALGRDRTQVSFARERVELTLRHSEIVMLLALHPEGLSGRELGRRLHGPDCNPITVRAEMSRLRRVLGSVLARNPYRLDADVSADFVALERDERAAALTAYAGPPLPSSRVPEIVAARRRLEAMRTGRPEDMRTERPEDLPTG